MKQAKNELSMLKRRTILFMDEVHRFNKGQQDAFLPHIESGLGKSTTYRRYRGASVRKRSKDKREMMVLKEEIGKEVCISAFFSKAQYHKVVFILMFLIFKAL